jgi:methylated-DNA-[protein]-cysteine S-methyltransferase
MAATVLQTVLVKTPIGPLRLVVHEGVLVALAFADRDERGETDLERRFGPIALEKQADPAGLATRLRGYFDGELRALDTIPVDTGGTPFQHAVWSALREIPVGSTVAYSELARRIGRPAAVRAVAAANARNPIAVVVPCHRVIGVDGSLTGYGGGLHRKQWLLAHEQAALPESCGRQGRLPLHG